MFNLENWAKYLKSMRIHYVGNTVGEQVFSYSVAGNTNCCNPFEGKFGSTYAFTFWLTIVLLGIYQKLPTIRKYIYARLFT